MHMYSNLYKHGEEKADYDFDIKNIIKRIKDNSMATHKLTVFIEENKSNIEGTSSSSDSFAQIKMLLNRKKPGDPDGQKDGGLSSLFKKTE